MISKKEIKKNNIINTAKQLFNEKSFEETSMAEIAQKAGVAKGTIYLYFPSKDDLFISILQNIFDDFYYELEKIIELDKTTLEKYELLRDIHFNFFIQNFEKHDIAAIFTNPNFIHKMLSKEHFELMVNNQKRFVELYRRIVVQGQHEGVVNKNINPLISAMFIESFITGTVEKLVMKIYANITDLETKKILDESFDFIMRSMMEPNFYINNRDEIDNVVKGES